ncbi:hypothetical protein BDZ89DRAFT_1144322 [Hymenopellis radicata]|nr:hypothetical protein BDZ89DRAFT_1144322 [Hymenopellis radicata]
MSVRLLHAHKHLLDSICGLTTVNRRHLTIVSGSIFDVVSRPSRPPSIHGEFKQDLSIYVFYTRHANIESAGWVAAGRDVRTPAGNDATNRRFTSIYEFRRGLKAIEPAVHPRFKQDLSIYVFYARHANIESAGWVAAGRDVRTRAGNDATNRRFTSIYEFRRGLKAIEPAVHPRFARALVCVRSGPYSYSFSYIAPFAEHYKEFPFDNNAASIMSLPEYDGSSSCCNSIAERAHASLRGAFIHRQHDAQNNASVIALALQVAQWAREIKLTDERDLGMKEGPHIEIDDIGTHSAVFLGVTGDGASA